MESTKERVRLLLSGHLNREVNENYVNTLSRIHSLSMRSLDAFTKSCKALGMSDDGLIEKVFDLIDGDGEGLNHAEVVIQKQPGSSRETASKKHKIDLSFVNDSGSEKVSSKIIVGRKKGSKIKINFEDDGDEDNENTLGLGDEERSSVKKPIRFKKIKKEEALRKKQETDSIEEVSPGRRIEEPKEDAIKSELNSSSGTSNTKLMSLSQYVKENKVIEVDNGLSAKAKERLLEIRKRKKSHKSQKSTIQVTEPVVESENLEDNPSDDTENDREWYNTDEYGHFDDTYNPFGGDEEKDLMKEQKLKQNHIKYMTSKKKARQQDNELWEKTQFKLSGWSGIQNEVEFDEDEESEQRIILSTHHLVPPFLDGKAVFTRQKELVSPVRDPESDMALLAKKGSFVLQERRQQRERKKRTQEAGNMVGTVLGNIIGASEKKIEKGQQSSERYVDNFDVTGQSDESKRNALKEQRKSLPAFHVKEDLLRVIKENQVTIIIGETGSGKTTQLTQFLYEEGYGELGLIGCTQPRRVAAMSVAKRVSEEMNVKLGNEVGFAIRFEDCSSNKTKIKYMTEGILLRETLADPDLDKYSCIIMDEAHERALNTDVLLGLFKNVLTKRKNLKLIVTSATMNADRFSNFFGGAPQFTIPGRTFPVDVMFSKSPVSDYVESAVKQILTIHLQFEAGDILVFMTGQEDVETTCEILADKLDQLDDPPKLEILPMYSQLPTDLQTKIFSKAPDGIRKVVVATNIAETSLTVDGIRYVVDPGYNKMKVFNPKLGMEVLQVVPISVASANQRSGRAGRIEAGSAFRLYTERAAKEEMYPQQVPEIQRTNLSNTLLLLKSLGADVLTFPFLDAPPQDNVTSSLYELWSLGALDNLGELTSLGHKMSSFPMEPSLGKLLLMSSEYGCAEEMITIVSMLSVNNIFYRPKERQDQADAARERFYVADSDHLTLLNVYSQWKANRYSEAWCSKYFLHAKQLKRAKNIRDQLTTIMVQQKLNVKSSGSDWDVVRKCICSAYYHQAAKARGFGEYSNMRTAMKMVLHPTSSLFGLGDLPVYVVYHELIFTSKEYMSVVTAVDPLWLLEFGSVFYGTKNTRYIVENDIRVITKDMVVKQLEEDKLKYDELKAQEQQKSKRKQNVVKTGTTSFRNRRGF